ncbi:MAG: flagellar biosynthesis protein FlgI [Rhodobacteraceae bacterium]|nr:MAG: flagellar biosynthesis protein FlgI [Paracoccaceae bacterium]
MIKWFSLVLISLHLSLISSFVYSDRLKDLTSIAGVRSNQLVGYGIVVGLNGTGDGNIGLTLQSMQSMVSRFGLVTDTAGLNGANTAAVMVTADMTAFAKPGQTIDITVSTLGKASSLRGGTLLMTPLLGADGETYAIAQGNLVVGGLGVTGQDGSSVVVNIPTVGRVPRGATIEKLVETQFLKSDNIILNLHQSDFSTSLEVSNAINEIFGPDVSVPLDASSIKVRSPKDPAQKVAFVSLLENIEIEPARPKAKVIVNARTGTIVIGGDVRVTPSVVTHGSMTVRVNEDPNVNQNNNLAMNSDQVVVTPGDATVTPDTEIDVDEEVAKAFIFDPGVELSEIVESINAVGASASDLVAILEALREAGSLRAELIII